MRFSNGKKRNGFDPMLMKPRVHLEDPHRLEIPIVISRYKHQKPTTINRSTEKRWPFKQERKTPDAPGRTFALCTWIRKKRALRKLENVKEKEKQRLREIAKREREMEFVKLMQQQQAYELPMPPEVIPLKEKSQPRAIKKKRPIEIKKEPKRETKKKTKKETKKDSKKKLKQLQEYREPELKIWKDPDTEYLKETKRDSRVSSWKDSQESTRKKPEKILPKCKSTFTTAKPKSMSKTVSVKKYCSHQKLTVRFVNYCYRICCQLFCCLTMLMLAGLAVILLI